MIGKLLADPTAAGVVEGSHKVQCRLRNGEVRTDGAVVNGVSRPGDGDSRQGEEVAGVEAHLRREAVEAGVSGVGGEDGQGLILAQVLRVFDADGFVVAYSAARVCIVCLQKKGKPGAGLPLMDSGISYGRAPSRLSPARKRTYSSAIR